MKELWAGENIATLNLLESELEAAGIHYIVKNENISFLAPAVGYVVPEIWVVDDTQMPTALDILTTITATKLDDEEPTATPADRTGYGWICAFIAMFAVAAIATIWGVVRGR